MYLIRAQLDELGIPFSLGRGAVKRAQKKRLRALVADDDPVCRILLDEILKRCGFTCDVVSDGAEAVEAFKRSHVEAQQYDLVCLDIQMPELSGVNAATEMRRFEKGAGIVPHAGARIMIISAQSFPPTASRSLFESGADTYLVKPVRPSTVRDRLFDLGLLDAPCPMRDRLAELGLE